MTLTQFVVKQSFRNKRRTAMTIISIGVSLLLLTLMMTVWRAFYIDQGAPETALRLMTRHRVSLAFFLPGSYRNKIRSVPGVVNVVPMSWFGGQYKDDKPENFFAQFGTDPAEAVKVYGEWHIPADQEQAWIRDRAGALVGRKLAEKHGWKIGDKIILNGTIFPVNLNLTIRAMTDAEDSAEALYFDYTYVEEAVNWAKGQDGMFAIRVDSADDVPIVAKSIDNMFRNSPTPTKTESEKAFQLGFIAMMGNVKAFILGISMAVVFAILLVSGNTMAMSIRERIREVAVLKTMGFTRRDVLVLFVGEGVAVSLVGGLAGVALANVLVKGVASSPAGGMLQGLTVTFPTLLVALAVAAFVGLVSAFIPAYRASDLSIAEGLRHLG